MSRVPDYPRQPSDGQQHQQPTAVVIVQQPVIVGGGAFVQGKPYLRRGVRLNNGRVIGTQCISSMGVLGGVLLFMGLVFLSVGISSFVGALFLIFGGGLLAACFKFCHKAKQDFDSLPQNHPDRVLYSTPVFRPNRRTGGAYPMATTATYQFPPGTQVMNAGNIQGNYPLGPNTQVIDGSAMGLLPTSANQRGSVFLTQYPGGMTSQNHQDMACSVPNQQMVPNPMEDKPPSYDEVCKNMSPP